MEKRQIKKKEYLKLYNELNYLEQSGVVTTETKQEIESSYEVVPNTNFIQVLLIIGSLLIGLGILSFVASNWEYLGKPFKYALILTIVGGFNYTGYYLRDRLPKTSKSLLYVGSIAFGAGIFLISQMFNYDINTPSLFLLWVSGVLPIAYHMEDKLMTNLAQIIILMYTNVGYSEYSNAGTLPITIILMVVIALINSGRLKSITVDVLNTITCLNVILILMDMANTEMPWNILIIFVIGVMLNYVPENRYKTANNVLGKILYFITGIMLTFEEPWEYVVKSVEGVTTYKTSILMPIFLILFIGYLLYRIKEGSMFDIVVLCAVIMRFYTDMTYDFMPKSLFFITGGLILMGFGYYFERQRKKVVHNE